MSIPITCSCGQSLSAPEDTAGGTFFCWSCGRPVPVPGPPRGGGFSSTPPSPARYPDTDLPTRRFTYPSGEWERVRSGLMSVNIGAILFLVFVLVLWVLFLDRKGPTTEGGARSLVLFLTLLTMAGVIMASIGTVMCTNVPQEVASRGPVGLAAAFMVGGTIGAVILGLLSLGSIMSNKPPDIGEGFSTFLLKLTLLGLEGGFLLFMFFQLITALHLEERGLASSVIGLQLLPIVFLAISPFGSPLAPVTATLGGPFGAGTATSKLETWINLFFVMTIARIVWFLAINVMLRSSIEAAERRQLQ